MPQDHARALREQGPIDRRFKWLGGIGALASIAAIVVAIVLTSNHKLAAGCFRTYLPGPIGAEPVAACGAAAREECSHLTTNAHITAKDIQILTGACEQAHLRVGHA